MKKEKILEMLQSDDIEIVALYTDILLKSEGIDKIRSILRDNIKYYIKSDTNSYATRFYLIKPRRELITVTGSFSGFTIEEEIEIPLSYIIKHKKEGKTPIYNSFLTPKKNIKYR